MSSEKYQGDVSFIGACTLGEYIGKVIQGQGHRDIGEFFESKWAQPLVLLYGEAKIRKYAKEYFEAKK